MKLLNKLKTDNTAEIKSISTTEIEIMNIIKSFKPKNSAECKGTSCKLLKCCAHITSTSFIHICNSSLKSGKYRERLKYSTVKPIYKKGNKTNMMHSRPNSLLTTLSKILQRVMFNILNQHL